DFRAMPCLICCISASGADRKRDSAGQIRMLQINARIDNTNVDRSWRTRWKMTQCSRQLYNSQVPLLWREGVIQLTGGLDGENLCYPHKTIRPALDGSCGGGAA